MYILNFKILFIYRQSVNLGALIMKNYHSKRIQIKVNRLSKHNVNCENKHIENSISKKIIAFIPLLSIIFTFIVRFISFGKYWYFQFDFNYSIFEVSYIDIFVLIYFAIFIVLGLLVIYSLHKLVGFIINKFTKKKKVEHCVLLLSIIFLYIIFCVAMFFLSYEILHFRNMSVYTALILLIDLGFFLCFVPLKDLFPSKNNFDFVKFVIILIAVILTFSLIYTMFQQNYNDAKNQSDFKIIQVLDEESLENYAVISEDSDNFSAYKCDINKNELTIYTNLHMSIKKDLCKYKVYHFDAIKYSNMVYEYNMDTNKYETVTLHSD